MRRKGLVTLSLVAVMSLSSVFSSFAAWTMDGTNWVYQNEDGSYAVNEWKKSGKFWFYLGEDGHMVLNKWHRDDDGKWYYLSQDGNMLTDTTTPDGYTVNEDGCWTVNGVVQIQ